MWILQALRGAIEVPELVSTACLDGGQRRALINQFTCAEDGHEEIFVAGTFWHRLDPRGLGGMNDLHRPRTSGFLIEDRIASELAIDGEAPHLLDAGIGDLRRLLAEFDLGLPGTARIANRAQLVNASER